MSRKHFYAVAIVIVIAIVLCLAIRPAAAQDATPDETTYYLIPNPLLQLLENWKSFAAVCGSGPDDLKCQTSVEENPLLNLGKVTTKSVSLGPVDFPGHPGETLTAIYQEVEYETGMATYPRSIMFIAGKYYEGNGCTVQTIYRYLMNFGSDGISTELRDESSGNTVCRDYSSSFTNSSQVPLYVLSPEANADKVAAITMEGDSVQVQVSSPDIIGDRLLVIVTGAFEVETQPDAQSAGGDMAVFFAAQAQPVYDEARIHAIDLGKSGGVFAGYVSVFDKNGSLINKYEVVPKTYAPTETPVKPNM